MPLPNQDLFISLSSNHGNYQYYSILNDAQKAVLSILTRKLAQISGKILPFLDSCEFMPSFEVHSVT